MRSFRCGSEAAGRSDDRVLGRCGRRLALAALPAVVALAAAPSAHASFAGANGGIGWLADTSGTSFAVFDPVSGSEHNVPSGSVEFPRNIAWSRSGTKVAFDGAAISAGTGNALFVENADGTGLKQVGRGDLKRFNPVWSPDGTKLAFVQDNGPSGSGDIYTITTSGANLTRLTTSQGWDGAPDWSPDGTRIAYTCMAGGRAQICQMTPSGAGKTVTTAALGLGAASNPSWAPNSANIAFGAINALGQRAIYRMSRSGASLRVLVAPDGYVGSYGPAWSPDGTKIATDEFAPGSGGAAAIRIRNAADGSNPVWGPGPEGEPQLDPSGWQRR